MRRRSFRELTRPEQRKNLLRRFNRQRREIEQLLRDEDAFNDILRSRGESPLPPDDEMVRLLAWIDQQLAQVKAT